jgi:hypothetical protein
MSSPLSRYDSNAILPVMVSLTPVVFVVVVTDVVTTGVILPTLQPLSNNAAMLKTGRNTSRILLFIIDLSFIR